MTHDEKLQAIRQKCIEANPNTWADYSERKCACGVRIQEWLDRHIRLADVLMALRSLPRKRAFACDDTGLIFSADVPTLKNKSEDCLWNLRQDSLDEQSEETVDFLYDLLC